MHEIEIEFRNARSYRSWIDKSRTTGYIRIIKRIKFSTFITLCRDTYLKLDRSLDLSRQIIIYIPRSLYDLMSRNVQEFITFCQSCTDVKIELSVR